MTKDADRQREIRLTRRQSGLCYDCGCVVGILSSVRCDECYTKKKNQDRRFREWRKSSGLCVKCGSDDVVTSGESARCLDCYMKTSASKIRIRTGYDISWKVLKSKWIEQNGLCAITGMKLTPGLDANLDHIIPVSRCAEPNDYSNIRWVYYRVNHAKYDMTDGEFVEFIDMLHRSLHHEK